MTEQAMTPIGTTELRAGWLEGLSMDTYLGDPAVSASFLWDFHQRTAAHARHDLEALEDDSTEAKNLGSLLHTLVYEPDEFEDRYVVIGQCEARKRDGDRCSNAGSVWRDGSSYCGVRGHDPLAGQPMADGIQTVDEAQKEDALAMKARLLEHPTASELLTAPGPREITGVWRDEETGLWCRIRPDQLIEDPPTVREAFHHSVPNLKSTGRDAGLESYPRHAERLGTYFKAAFYRLGISELSWWPQSFLYPVVETFAPHEVIVYRLDDDSLDVGEAEVREAMRKLARCVETGEWPGYGPEVYSLRIAEWRLRQVQDIDFLGAA